MPKKQEKKKHRMKIAYYDADGKRRGKTFTGSDEHECHLKMEIWKQEQNKPESTSMTLLKAVEDYISIKEAVLSPSTIRAYDSIKRTHIEGSRWADMDVFDITSKDGQIWISELVNKGIKAKTIHNCWGLFYSAVKLHTQKSLCVTLPQKIDYDGYTPSDADVNKLISAIRKKKDKELLIAVNLAAFGPMRRGEICAVSSDDVKGNTIHVHSDMIRNRDGAWIIKPTPKTHSSNRRIEFPDFVMKDIKGKRGRIVTMTPDVLGKKFRNVVRESNIEYFRLHDLRHYNAAILHAIGVPDQYIMDRGGWKTDNVMKRVYRNAIDDVKKIQNKKITEHFNYVNQNLTTA